MTPPPPPTIKHKIASVELRIRRTCANWNPISGPSGYYSLINYSAIQL